MFKKREKVRGFNQARLIAESMGKMFNKPVVNLLTKTEDTKDQASLNKEQRLLNLQNVFSINPKSHQSARAGLAQNKSILLVDDVFTTGATMRECCKIIKKSGVQNIWGFTLARTI